MVPSIVRIYLGETKGPPSEMFRRVEEARDRTRRENEIIEAELASLRKELEGVRERSERIRGELADAVAKLQAVLPAEEE
ncbi:hypothetical protein FRC08_011406 [Ceratobasidium sp. 394]|nr:hypothetical protein FRC08_011406 [Ceratobasidium sp. 394]